MKVVFIGCGYLGYNLSEQLGKDFDVSVLGLESPYTIHSSYFKKCDVFDMAQIINQDLEDAIVIDTVSLVSNRTTAFDENKFLEDLGFKYQGLIDVLKAKHIKRYIYLSSGGSIYGEATCAVNENHELSPKSLYGKSKKYLEKLIIDSGIDYVILRPSNPFGGFQVTNGQGVIPILINCALDNKPFETYVEMTSERDYFYIDDFAQGLRKLIEKDVSCEIYNLGYGVPILLKDVIKAIEDATSKEINIIHGPIDPNAVNSIVLNVDKLKNDVGYEPLVSFEEGIKREVSRIKGE